jgi:hypothetical protein
MNIVEQVKLAVETSPKVFVPIFISCIAVSTSNHIFPDVFLGLPKWVIPLIHVMSIVTLTLTAIWIAGLIFHLIKKGWIRLSKWHRKRAIKNALLNVSLIELIILCRAMAGIDRSFFLPPDGPVTLKLLEKGLIQATLSFQGGLRQMPNHEIPMSTWKLMHSMAEFAEANGKALINALERQCLTEEQIVQYLPPKHPSVLSCIPNNKIEEI